MDGVNDSYAHTWNKLLYWLASMDPVKLTTVPFSMYYEQQTLQKYAELWAGLVVSCLQSHRDSNKYRVPLRPHQYMLLKMVERVLEKDSGKDEFERILMYALLEFLVSQELE
jgi:hypothetical protein